jgi:hypothetical protein
MKLYWIRVGPKSDMTLILIITEEFGYKYTQKGTMLCEDGNRSWSDVSEGKGSQ